MSIIRETYDITNDAANDTISRIKAYYDSHPMPDDDEENGDSVAFYLDEYIEQVIKGWKDIENSRHPYDYNKQMAEHSDRSPATLRRIYNKKWFFLHARSNWAGYVLF